MRNRKRAALIARQQALVDAARAAGRELTEDEQKQFDEYQRQIDAIPEEEPEPAPEPAPDGIRAAVEAERQRVSDITALCRDFNISPDAYVNGGNSIDEVRAAVLNELREHGQPVNVQVTRDEGETFRQRAADALLMRANIPVENPADGAEELRATSLRDLGIMCLSREGQSADSLIRMDGDQLYGELSRQFYNPTAAFPAILDQTIRKSIVTLYNHVPTTFEAFTTAGTLHDFKTTADHEYVIGGVGDFLQVPENGEIKPDLPRTELLPQRKLETYGKQFSMTRQAFINDDIGFLTEVPGLYATKAKQTIDKQVYSILFNNAKIFDGVELFSDKHANKMKTGEKPTQTSIQAAILKMQRQKDQFGEPIYMTPRYLIVPVGYEFDLSVIFHTAQVVGSNNNDYNPLYNYPLTIVQTPVLNALAGAKACPWFLAADHASARGIQVDYLNGQKVPTVRRMEVPGTLGFVWDIYLDWGIAVRDFRGIVRNDGVAISTEE